MFLPSDTQQVNVHWLISLIALQNLDIQWGYLYISRHFPLSLSKQITRIYQAIRLSTSISFLFPCHPPRSEWNRHHIPLQSTGISCRLVKDYKETLQLLMACNRLLIASCSLSSWLAFVEVQMWRAQYWTSRAIQTTCDIQYIQQAIAVRDFLLIWKQTTPNDLSQHINKVSCGKR